MCAFWVLKPLNTVCWHYICLNYSFEAGSENQIGGWSYNERSERSSIRNRSGVGRTERGLVSWMDGCRSGIAGFERGCNRNTARIQRGLIGDRYALQSERVIFYPIIPEQAIKIGQPWSLVGRLSGVNVALNRVLIRCMSWLISFSWDYSTCEERKPRITKWKFLSTMKFEPMTFRFRSELAKLLATWVCS